MTGRVATRLALDEMFSPAMAHALREPGHDVMAVAERPDLRALTDEGSSSGQQGGTVVAHRERE
jgi:hypothetical protein